MASSNPLNGCGDPGIIPAPCTSFVQQPTVQPGSLQDLLNSTWDRVFGIIFLVLGIVAVIMLIYAGIQYITAAGQSAELVKKARQNILNVMLGIIIVITSYGIISFLISFFTSVAKKA